MANAAFGILFLIVGCAMLTFRKVFAREVIRQQNELFRSDFGEREEMTSVFVVTIVGVGFVAFGVLMLLNVINIL